MQDWCWHDHGQRETREDNETCGFVCASQHCEPWTGPRGSAPRAAQVLSAPAFRDRRRVRGQGNQRFTGTTTFARQADDCLPEAACGCRRGVPLRPICEKPATTRACTGGVPRHSVSTSSACTKESIPQLPTVASYSEFSLRSQSLSGNSSATASDRDWLRRGPRVSA